METPLPLIEEDRPQTRGDCLPGGMNELRPCPYALCRYHIYADVTESGTLKVSFPDKELWDLEETCALDVAERGGVTLEDVGRIMNVTRERIRQLEAVGLQKLRRPIRRMTK